jgi:hypothetical protein
MTCFAGNKTRLYVCLGILCPKSTSAIVLLNSGTFVQVGGCCVTVGGSISWLLGPCLGTQDSRDIALPGTLLVLALGMPMKQPKRPACNAIGRTTEVSSPSE